MKCFRFLLAALCGLFLNSSLSAQGVNERTETDPSGDWISKKALATLKPAMATK
jgi:outer membrane protein assembly factor BamE (lipoprotein component of BamABCDE complex)